MHNTFLNDNLQLLGLINLIIFSNFCCGISENNNNTSSRNSSTGFITSDLETRNVCGRIQYSSVNQTFEFDVFDREEVNPCLTDIHDSETHENFEYLQVEKGCEMKLCVLEFLQPDNPTRKRVCYTFTNNSALKESENEYLKYFYVVVVSCSCKKPGLSCKNVKCESVILEEHECTRLYKEPFCRECRYEHTSLTATSSLIPSNSFSVDSFIVKPGCNLDIKSVSEANKPPEYTYSGIYNFSQLSYVQKPNKSRFTCSCSSDDEEIIGDTIKYDTIVEQISENKKDTCSLRLVGNGADVVEIENDSSSTKIIIAFAIPLIVIIIITFAYAKTLLNVKNIKDKLEADAVARFHAGQSESQLVINLHQENPNNVSLGYAQALKLPYEKKYEIPRSCITIDEEQELGNGAFGKVLLGKLMPTKINNNSKTETLVAVKISKCNASIDYFICHLDEIKILAYIGSHPNVVRLIGACTENIKPRDALIILEFCCKGSLKSYLNANKKSFLNSVTETDTSTEQIPINSAGYAILPKISANSEDVSYVTIKPEFLCYFNKWAKEIATGMEYLSSKHVVHIDLAARNILLTGELIAKIGDFGLSKRMQNVANYVRVGAECPLPFRCMAPESLTQCRFSTQSDIWSYGVTLWEIFSLGDDPYDTILTCHELIQFLRSNQRLNKPVHSSDEIYNEMLHCWAYNPSDRPSFSQLKTFFELQNEWSDSDEDTRF